MQVNHREVSMQSSGDERNSARLNLCVHTGTVTVQQGLRADLVKLSFHQEKKSIAVVNVTAACYEGSDFLKTDETDKLTIVFAQAGGTFLRIIAIFPNFTSRQVSRVEELIATEDEVGMIFFVKKLIKERKPFFSKYLLQKIKKHNKQKK